jgi:hypothetical protein
VVGSSEYDGLLPGSVAARVAAGLSARRRHGMTVPLIVVPTEPPIAAPAELAAPHEAVLSPAA